MHDEIVYADPTLRKRIVIWIVIIAALAVILRIWILPPILEHMRDMDPDSVLTWIKTMLIGILILPLPICAYLMVFAIRVLKQDRFPPVGTRVIKDTPVLYGQHARMRAMAVLFIITVILALVIALYASATTLLNSLYP